MEASNGRQKGEMEYYENTESLLRMADALEAFPKDKDDCFLWELGSEHPEDRYAYYFNFRVFLTNSSGHCAIHFRFNNNERVPDREISEFCIVGIVPSQLHRLGTLRRRFAQLEHDVLEWTISEGKLYKIRDEAFPRS